LQLLRKSCTTDQQIVTCPGTKTEATLNCYFKQSTSNQKSIKPIKPAQVTY